MTPESTFSYESVMVIDDNDIDRYIAKRIMTVHHFSKQLLSYENAFEALEYLKTHQHETAALPDVILVDIYMPEMSGFEFMDAYDSLSAKLKQHCAVYIISSTIDPEDLQRANDDPNVTAFHVKPLDRKFLSEISKRRE